MAAFMLESLVLRGSVRLDVLGYLRLASVVASRQAPEVINSSQPLPGTRPTGPKPNGRGADVVDTTQGTRPGAGRSRRHAGTPCCQGTARITAAITSPWWRHSGGQAPAAAAKRQALFAGFVASVVEGSPVRGISAAPIMGRGERSR